MQKETKEIIKLTTIQIFKLIVGVVELTDYAFSRKRSNPFEIDNALNSFAFNRQDFFKKIHYLKQKGYIRRFTENKKQYLEITPKGIDHLKEVSLDDLQIKKIKNWDGKWRVVIFDIPEKLRSVRNGIREKLYQLGFKQVQKSVFVYPFECTKEINYICDFYGGREFLKFMIADIIEGEKEIINHFISTEILSAKDIKKK